MGNNSLDLSGRVFGSLHVLARAGVSPRGAILWSCHCDRCGCDSEIESFRLTSGKIDCGCVYRDRISDLTGQHIGVLQVIRRSGSSPYGDIQYTVRCDICGAEKVLPACTIRSRLKSCGCEQYNEIRASELSQLWIATNFVDGVNLSAAYATAPTKASRTGLRGVYFDGKKNCYFAECVVGGVRWRRSGYKTAEEAKKDRDAKHDEMLAEKGLL